MSSCSVTVKYYVNDKQKEQSPYISIKVQIQHGMRSKRTKNLFGVGCRQYFFKEFKTSIQY